ncbi:MarR family winged helix-turn-helix transcriptional regulator [Limnohabitans sp.]|jgi:DNA-binding MarR family transcriptional regulator|uniref:MarR family winged helix-turn-helix transcriptional regulator n=1 Tax=Limnohabitans sp. TaxID=1907725 RepID=UPI0037BE51DE
MLFILEPILPFAANDPAEPETGSSAMLVRHRLDALTHARLWRNPCGFAARFNYLSLRYNTPLYGWVEERFGLTRAEFVVLYNLGLFDGVTASEIAVSTAFPKNTLSRAVNRIAKLGLIARSEARTDRRQQNLTLTPAGQAILDEAIPRFMALEEEMLSSLSLVERETLSVLMAKVVLSMFDSQLQPSAEPAQP